MSTWLSDWIPRDEAIRNIISSAAAGLAGRLICHPIDTIKAQLQAGKVSCGTNSSLNIRALYRGLGVTLIGGIPATAIYLNTYDYTKQMMSEQKNPIPQFIVYMTAGMVAEALACIVFVPVDVMKERMQVQGLNASSQGVYYRNTFDAVRQISKQEGLIRGFYRGYNATLLSFGPFSAIYFALYEGLKPVVSQRMNNNSENVIAETAFSSNLVASALAGASASWMTNPLDLAKLRLQIARMADKEVSAQSAGLNLNSTGGMLKYVYRREGLRGLYRGALTRVFFHAPHTAVTLVAYDEFKKVLNK